MTDGIFLARPEQPDRGTTLAVKDLFDTAGLTTTYGSAIFAGHVPSETAEAVVRLETAGYATVGKTNLHEFAYGVTSENPHFGTVPNPLAPGRIAGGSSGGSAAALAAGLADAALGSDSGGSVRIPAACCGVVGFKPTYGRVPLGGCFPLAPTFDTAGPMARSVRECVRMMAALVPALEGASVAVEDVSVGVAWLERCDPLVRRRVEEAVERFPRRRSVDAPLPSGIAAAFEREVADVHRELFRESAELYGEEVRAKVEKCLRVTDAEYETAIAARDEYRARLAGALEAVDLLVTPTLAFVAPPVGANHGERVRDALIRFTYPANIAGLPALALPCGPAEEGLPASVQIIGRAGDDGLVLGAGETLEAALSLR
jgi:aspartyl-tRNA(Asn)/glutamyl-tRNA(Gln) amidotransferase subunit A